MQKGSRLGKRHTQCLIVFLGLATSFCMRSQLSVAIVSMTTKSNLNDAPVLTWDSRIKGTIMSSFYWGYIFTLILAGRVCEKFGHKLPMVIAMLLAGIIMVLTPFAAIYGGFYLMVATRILLGITQAVMVPAANVFISKWAPTEEKGMLFCFVFSGFEFGIVVTMMTAGVLADSRWGWPSIFYACGGITLLWSLIYAYVGCNSPQDHSTISEHEKLYILSSLQNNAEEKDNLKTPPWKAIVSSVPLYVTIIAQCVNCWGYYTILFQAPSYLNAVLGFNTKQSGMVTGLPYMSSMLTVYIYAVVNYWLTNKKKISRTAQLKAWNTYCFWGSGLALFLMAFTGENKTSFIALMAIAMAINSSYHAGYHTNLTDLSPNFAGTLTGIATVISTLCTLSTPLYVGFIVTDPKSVFSWRVVFLTAAGLYFVGNLFFILFATAEVQPWNFASSSVKPDAETAISKDKDSGNEGGHLK